MDASAIDCLIVGGGPAGLTAAIYLGRYRRHTLLIDAGHSRAALIPESHNYPGYSGIAGKDLLLLLRRQAEKYGSRLEHGQVDALARERDGFVATGGTGRIAARRVLLATGIVDDCPPIPGFSEALAAGALRFCPVCDAYEAMDRRIGVMGPLPRAVAKARFLRTYSRDVSVLRTDRPAPIAEAVARTICEAGLKVPAGTVDCIERAGDKIVVALTDGERCELDVLYPALGARVRSDLATSLTARCSDEKCLYVDEHQRTSVDGLFAAGDVVSDLHQISVAVGHAAIAATAMHNSLPPNYR